MTERDQERGQAPASGVTRRGLLRTAGVAGAGLGLGLGVGGFLAGRESADAGSGDGGGTGVVPFYGDRQAGIVTAAQDRLHFAAFDLTAPDRAALIELLAAWTEAAAQMTAGEPVGERNGEPLLPPEDTGEAVGHLPSRLTITFGFGPSLFDQRFGLSGVRPAPLRQFGPLPAEAIDPARSGGDLCVQACSDDPQVAFHAVRNLARIGRGAVVMRWSQLGFGRTSTTTRAQDTPRNLMGFKDGTNNIRAEDTDALERFVWAGDEAPGWLRGGSYLVARRIRMLIEVWDRATLSDQELTIGRTKVAGSPLGESGEFATPDLGARGPDGPVIPADAHIRLSAPSLNDEVRILRRGYSFTDGFDEVTGQLDAGLFFISFQRDPTQFEALQRRLAGDALNEYIKHTSSAVFAVPPGTPAGGYVGQSLFA